MHAAQLPATSGHRTLAAQWQDEFDNGDRPSTRSSNEQPEHAAHVRSRSTAHAQSPKRRSVFSGRTRSNTTTSTASSRRSPASSLTSTDVSSLNSSHEDRTAFGHGPRHEKQESVTKSLLSRGSRILRRQGSKFNVSATLDEEDEGDREKSKFEVPELFSRSHKSRQSDAHQQLKRIISEPFDFHHLTHTSPSQFQSLDKARENDLVTEFSAIRASQRPETGLKGIRAEDLQFRNFSSESLANCEATAGEHAHPSVPSSPTTSPGPSVPVSPTRQTLRSRRESHVFENFSRPVTRQQKTRSTSPTLSTSPKLANSPDLSEPAPRAIDEILGLHSQQTYPDYVYSTTEYAENGPSMTRANMEAMLAPDFDQAFAATSESGVTARSSMNTHPSDLEDVPEEDEVTHWHDSPEPSCHSRQPSAAALPASITVPKSRLSVFVADELSKKFSEVLGSPTLPQHRLFQENSPSSSEEFSKRSRATTKGSCDIYESWDEDIDYCYEHAAEADCEFDWLRNSLDEHERPDINARVSGSIMEQKSGRHGQNQVFGQVKLAPSALPTPDLEPSPGSLANSQVPVTPSTSAYENELVAHGGQSLAGDYFQPVSFGKHTPQETLYEEFLTADGGSDRHFTFCSQGAFQSIDHPISPRSSFSPISKCNSRESLILSRAASIVRKHRSSASTTSVPELVHSSTSSREYTMPEHSDSTEQLGRPASISRPDSSHHRQTKSLAREIESHILRKGSNAGFDITDITPSHDRARSASEVEARILPLKGVGRRKGSRGASYSLFPAAI